MAPELKRRRLLDAAASLLAAASGNCLNIVLLNKALFYFDLASLRDEGEVFTHNTYVAIELGPVIAKYPTKLVEALEKSGIATQSSFGQAKPVTLLRRPPTEINGALDETAKRIAKWICRMSSTAASDLSHENIGWRIARREALKFNKPAVPVNMLIAMQQIMDDDPWLTEPLTGASADALLAADQDQGQPW